MRKLFRLFLIAGMRFLALLALVIGGARHNENLLAQ